MGLGQEMEGSEKGAVATGLGMGMGWGWAGLGRAVA